MRQKRARRVRVKVLCYLLSLVLGTVIGRYLLIRIRRKLLGLPPGMIGLPLFGCLLSLAFKPKQFLSYLGQTYGKVCTIRIGNKDIVVINDVTLYKQLNEIADLNLHRPPTKYSIWGYPCFALNTNGKEWRHHKSIIMTTLMSQVNTGFVHSLFSDYFGCIILPEIQEHINRPWQPGKVCDFFAFSVLYSALFEDKITDLSDTKFEAFRDGMTQVMKQMSKFLIASKLPTIFRCILYNHQKTMQYNEKLLFPVLREALKHRKLRLAAGHPATTMIDYMLLDESITDEYILGNVMAMMAGGLKSTATRLKVAIYHLAFYPEVYERIYQELQRVYPSGQFSFDRLAECHLLRAYIFEVIRTSTLIPFAGGRVVKNPDGIHVDSYHFAHGTVLMANCYFMDIHNGFDYPHTIHLQHFLDANTQRFKMHRDFIGFGVGRRNCPGQSIALRQIYMAIATIILSGYQLKLSPNDRHYAVLQKSPHEREAHVVLQQLDNIIVVVSKRENLDRMKLN